MNGFRINQISQSECRALMELFAACFQEDSYYAKLFPNKSTRTAKLKKVFEEPVRYCVNHNGAYGAYDKESLIGFVLFFDYQRMKYSDNLQFKSMFKGTSKNGPLPYQTKLHDKIDCLGERSIYLLSVGVDQAYQRRGIASGFIDFLLSGYPNHYLVSDISSIIKRRKIPLMRG